MTHKEKARDYFIKGYNCSQALFAAFTDVTGMSEETALKIAAPFGAGMGKMREVCGAVSGMFMVAGLIYGYSENPDAKVKEEHYKIIQHLAEEFKKENGGSSICRELLAGLKTNTLPAPDERTAEYYKKRPCLKIVESAAEILDSYLNGN